MGRRKKKLVGRVISVRVTDDELETFHEIMRSTRKSSSSIMREAIRQVIARSS